MDKTLNNVNLTGTCTKISKREGESKKGNKYFIVNMVIKQKVSGKTLSQYCTTFNIKKDMPLKEFDVIRIEGAIIKPNNYKDQNGNWVNTVGLECSNACITNLTENIVLQEAQEDEKITIEFDIASKTSNSDSDIDF